MKPLDIEHVDKVLVLGGGIFGTRAVRHAIESKFRTLVVDTDHSCRARSVCERSVVDFSDLEPGKAGLIIGKAVHETLRLLREDPPDIIVPCIPGHLAGLVLEAAMDDKGVPYARGSRAIIDVMSRVDPALVFKSDIRTGTLVTSLMPPGGTCDPGCGQPEQRCPVSGLIKTENMDAILSDACEEASDVSVVLTSRLIGSGVGCFDTSQLAGLITTVMGRRGPFSVTVGTSCSCHGILSFYDVG